MDAWCSSRGVDTTAVADLDLALDEVVANIIHHGYGPDAPAAIRLGIRLEGGRVRLEVVDRAPEFNPLEASEPGPHSAAGGGGFGVHLVRKLMDRVEYVRENGENRLALERRAGSRQ